MEWWIILLIVIAVGIIAFLLGPCVGGAIYRWNTTMAQPTRMDGKVVIVTGASAGIGKEAALSFAQMGTRVIMDCRNLKKAQSIADDIMQQTGNNNVMVRQLDVSDLNSVRSFAMGINEEEPHIHVLLNNAGIALGGEKKTSAQGFELHLATNHYGGFLLTNLLIGKLKNSAPSRVVTVSSIGHIWDEMNVDDLNFEIRPYIATHAYRQSKLCNVLFLNELSKRLRGTGVTSNSLHPGLVQTEIFSKGGQFFANVADRGVSVIGKTQVQGAQTSIYLCSSSEVEGQTGNYYVNCQKVNPSRKARDEDLARKLWEVSAKDVKLTAAEAAVL